MGHWALGDLKDFDGAGAHGGALIPAEGIKQLLSTHQQTITSNSNAEFDSIGSGFGFGTVNHPGLSSGFVDNPNGGSRMWRLDYQFYSGDFTDGQLRGFRNEPCPAIPGVLYTAKAYLYANGWHGTYNSNPDHGGDPDTEDDTEAGTGDWGARTDSAEFFQYTPQTDPDYQFKTRLNFLDSGGGSISYVEDSTSQVLLGCASTSGSFNDLWNWIEVSGVAPAGTRYVAVDRGLINFKHASPWSPTSPRVYVDRMSLLQDAHDAIYPDGTLAEDVPDAVPGDPKWQSVTTPPIYVPPGS